MTPQIEFVPATGSTNADLLARLAAGETVPEGYWRVADRQTGGRGRQGREWIDAPGNFMGSTVVRLLPLDPPAASLSFLAAMAVYEAVLPHLAPGQMLQLKWPNDLLVGGAKLCGILLEREGDSAVVGIGVNLAAAPHVEGRGVAALQGVDRNRFASDLAASFERELHRWRTFGTDALFGRWCKAAHPIGTALQVHESGTQTVSGTFAGLESDGALRLRLPHGAIRVIRAGDVMLED